jgi:hypothetical protein
VLEGLFGWTLGKRVTGLVVLAEDGSPIDIRSALKRNLLRVVDGLFFYLVAAVAGVGLTDASTVRGPSGAYGRGARVEPARRRHHPATASARRLFGESVTSASHTVTIAVSLRTR